MLLASYGEEQEENRGLLLCSSTVRRRRMRSITRVSEDFYSIAFRNHQDQQEVLRRSEHSIDLTDGRLGFRVKGSLSPRSSSEENNTIAPAEIPVRKGLSLLGKTGSGKSHLANTILGKELFLIYHSSSSGTKTCQWETGTVNGRSLTLIDTPGFFDTARSEEELKPEIMSCLAECAPGPHVFLIVLKVDKFTEHEKHVFTKICEHFSEEALNYGVIVFTHGGQLEERMKIEEFIKENEDLSKLVEIYGGRCHVLDNKHWNGDEQDGYRSNRFQLEELLQTVDKMMVEKIRPYYTNGVLQHLEERIQLEEKQIKKMAVDLPPHEIRKRAQINVSNDAVSRNLHRSFVGGIFWSGSLVARGFERSYQPR